MRKIYSLAILVFSITMYTCSSYIDTSNNIYSKSLEFIFKGNYNEFVNKNKVAMTTGNEVFRPRNYLIKLPKKIVHWELIDNILYVEYPAKQIICVKAKYLNDNVKEGQWKLINPDEETMEKMLSDYWEEKNYNFDNIRARNHRITKLYTNGIFSILLYNIKEKNFDHFLYMVKSIEEIKYKAPDN